MSTPTTEDPLAGWQEETSYTFDHRLDVVFALLIDVERMASLGAEHVKASWETDDHGLGAHFIGVNELEGRRWEVRCQVVELDAPVSFSWAVGKPVTPSSVWRYDLAAHDRGTSVRQTFRHGPGFSYVRRSVEQDPGRAAQIMQARGEQLRHNMADVLARAGALLDAGRRDQPST